MSIRTATWIILSLMGAALQAQPMIRLEPVVVTASRIDSAWAVHSRETFVMPRTRMDDAPAESVIDLVQYTGGCDVAGRGADGIQADFSIRGSSFEQVLVLLDGVRMNNPQTGHHTANVPVTPADIDRIEVLAGHASSLYGSSAFGGVVHLLTRSPEKNRLKVELKGGSDNTVSGSLMQTFRTGSLSGTLHLDRSQSDGYRFDSDYRVTSFTYRSSAKFGKNRIGWSFRHQEKDFGANGFYADYPSRENTLSQQGEVELESSFRSGLQVKSQFFVNRHRDFFLLDMNQPDGYQNRHTTWVSGGSVQTSGRLSKNGNFAAGLEGTDERMTSSRMGSHQRVNVSPWNETAFSPVRNFSLNMGWRWDFWTNQRTQINPSLGVAYAFPAGIEWKASAGRVFRYPNFTELYYNDPANTGDPQLKPEYGWCCETGAVWKGKCTRWEMTLFRRDEHDRIDWVKTAINEPWRVANLPRNTVSGISLSCNRSFGSAVFLDAFLTTMHSSVPSDLWSKYLSNSLERQLGASATIEWPWSLRQGLFLTVKKRRHSDAIAFLDSRMTRRWKNLTFFVSCTNVMDEQGEDIPGIPVPGRRFMTGTLLAIDE